MFRSIPCGLLLLAGAFLAPDCPQAIAQTATPNRQELLQAYERAERYHQDVGNRAVGLQLTPRWLPDGSMTVRLRVV